MDKDDSDRSKVQRTLVRDGRRLSIMWFGTAFINDEVVGKKIFLAKVKDSGWKFVTVNY